MTHPVPKQWLWLDTALSWIALLGILTCLGLIDFHGLRPLDVGGTLFGGSFNQLMYAGAWIAAMAGLLLATAFRLDGHRAAWCMAGIVQTGAGAWWLLHYPATHDGNLLLSPEREEIAAAMLVGMALLIGGVFLHVRAARARRRRPISHTRMVVRSVVAGSLILIFIAIPLANALRAPLPHCAFSKAGSQLTVCLDASDTPVIVD
ncbi:hypothetical protein [Cupriavidus basilensis]|uniref:hypothetical protein n=1 Tax=Cupriavidus basilensis TaxID=68895 RepID=UPI0020A62E23|nr:hypothetical protein [Cupriavidus basilensis]MCP3023603.1 hypothetical protein [Cupriavidus basilensis]MDR3382963.1 hypothetical protein [Cupriavidus basilensis]